MESKKHVKIELLSLIPITALCVSLFCFGVGSWRNMMESLNVSLTTCLILVFGSLFPFLKNKTTLIDQIINANLLLSLIVIVVGITQLFGIVPSLNRRFLFTGTFYSITQYAMLLSFVFPICLLYGIRSKGKNKFIFLTITVILFIMAVISKSRSAIIAEVLAFMIIVFCECSNVRTNLLLLTKRWFPCILILSFAFIYIMYRFKADSANGRVLMWLISFDMFLDKPLFGFGLKGFESDYMLYQANYFIANPDSPFAQLADNTYHPYNEFIRIAVCFGVFGILILLSLIYVIISRAIANKGRWRPYLLASLATLFVWCMFSFPLDVSFIWALSISWFLILPDGVELKRRVIKTRIIISSLFLVLLGVCVYNSIYVMQWKKTERLSLRGQTEAMLPEYDRLYSKLKRNGPFLYNYGAELHYIKKYRESQDILLECERLQNGYNVQMIMADNYRHTNMTKKAVECYDLASNMAPCRYLPLYDQMKMLLETRDTMSAIELAKKIMNKKVKVESDYLDKIIAETDVLINKKKSTIDNNKTP